MDREGWDFGGGGGRMEGWWEEGFYRTLKGTWQQDFFLRFYKGMGTTALTKKKKKNFLIFKEIQKGPVAKSYMTNGLLIHD
jgi:hypothetical protein